jgi:hypothetical protein
MVNLDIITLDNILSFLLTIIIILISIKYIHLHNEEPFKDYIKSHERRKKELEKKRM